MGLILDTSVLIAAEKRQFDLLGLFTEYPAEPFFIAAITAAELLHGVERARPPSRREARSCFVEAMLGQLEVIAFDLGVARHHARLWADLEQCGTKIGSYDLLIAATALHGRHKLATLNTVEFRRVPSLILVELTPHTKPQP